jgi:hypothetical protein
MAFTARVITTEEWGARQAGPFQKTFPKFIVVHHTDSRNPPADPSQGTIDGAKKLARAIQRDHIDDNDWLDSGHNFLNTTGGVILEGRHGSLKSVQQGFCVQSAHALQDRFKIAGGNESPGIENEGNFMTFQMGQMQWDSLVELCVSLCESCDISPANIRGHREFSNTDCPGDWLFAQLPRLRQAVTDKLSIPMNPLDLMNVFPGQILKLGSVGAGVIKLQRRLQEKGFRPGAIDGIFGEGTRAALISFQQSIGLKNDGVAGPKTLSALDLS